MQFQVVSRKTITGQAAQKRLAKAFDVLFDLAEKRETVDSRNLGRRDESTANGKLAREPANGVYHASEE
jgi:hypothetical protein